jgi:hypothetical protein
VTDCVCPKGTFSRQFQTHNSSNGKVTSCEICMLGLDCESDWPNSWNAVGNPTSLASPGFYTQTSAPYETYRCCFGRTCEEDCPGGAPESCSFDRTGLVCDACTEEDYFIKEGKCQRCPLLTKFLLLFVVIVSVVGCFLLDKWSSDSGRRQSPRDTLVTWLGGYISSNIWGDKRLGY